MNGLGAHKIPDLWKEKRMEFVALPEMNLNDILDWNDGDDGDDNDKKDEWFLAISSTEWQTLH